MNIRNNLLLTTHQMFAYEADALGIVAGVVLPLKGRGTGLVIGYTIQSTALQISYGLARVLMTPGPDIA